MNAQIVFGYVPTVRIKRMGFFAHLADMLMVPFMYLISGTLKEAPQRTHFWNNKKLGLGALLSMEHSYTVHCKGVKSQQRLWHRVPMFHIPVLGGWKQYVVIEPLDHPHCMWHPGWVAHDVAGVSLLTLRGPVRLLIGTDDVSFCGFEEGNQFRQIPVRKVGEGRIGDGGPFAKLPLL